MRRIRRLFFLLPLMAACLLPPSPAKAYFTLLDIRPPLVSNPKLRNLDVRIAFGLPFEQSAVDMDPLQMFAALRYPAEEGGQIERHELLDRLSPVVFLGKKAWQGKIPLLEPGLYQLVLETRPYWDEKRGIFLQQFAQSLIPVLGVEHGWDAPVGLKLEILPLTRPFGLAAPALFTGRVLYDGKVLPDTPIRIVYFNTDKRTAPTPHPHVQAVRSAENGVFSFVCPWPGWWGFAARTSGDPLKGPDGQAKQTELSGVLWIYVDSQNAFAPKKSGDGQNSD